MTSYISRVFSRPSLASQATPPPSQDRLAEHETAQETHDDLNHIDNAHPNRRIATSEKIRSPPPTSQRSPRASSSQSRQAVDHPAGTDQNSQFQVMTISTLLTQNSNLLAQNLEMSRENERLRAASMKDMEAFKKELKEEVQGMVRDAIRGLVDTLRELRPTPRPTPPATGSGSGSGSGEPTFQMAPEMERQDFSDLINDHQDTEDEESDNTESNKDKGKRKAIGESGGGVDPNDLRLQPPRATFMALDASPSVEQDGAGQQYQDHGEWSFDSQGASGGGGFGRDTFGSQRLRASPSVENTMIDTQLSAIAQQVVDMQNQDEEMNTGASGDSASPPSPKEGPAGPTTPSKSSRPVRQSTTKVGSYKIPLPEDLDLGSVTKKGSGKGKGRGKAKVITPKSGSQKKRKTQSEPTQGRKRRTYKGRVSMTARPLGRSDGIKRGEGVWPDKGGNTVKGNMQEIACDICNGRVHWACAGLEDDSVAPDEWECPDCTLKIAHGESRTSIEKSPQTQCIRPTCILREKKKILFKDGDADEYYVERYMGRRAVGRRADKTSRIFEYLVKWLGYSRDVSTWQHESELPKNNNYADDLLQDCARLGVDTKKRVAILPEARKWFDEDGELIDAETDDDDDDEGDVNGAGSSQPRAQPTTTQAWSRVARDEHGDDEKEDD